jgi:hypothetical protein
LLSFIISQRSISVEADGKIELFLIGMREQQFKKLELPAACNPCKAGKRASGIVISNILYLEPVGIIRRRK